MSIYKQETGLSKSITLRVVGLMIGDPPKHTKP